jgi:hypothetical protein
VILQFVYTVWENNSTTINPRNLIQL